MSSVKYPVPDLATLSDVPDMPDAHSLRLAAVIALLPTGTQTRTANALQRAKIHTLAALCRKKRSDLHRSKSVGRKIVDDLQTALARYGLTLASKTSSQEKPKPSPNRVSNPIWLREQLRELLKDCDDNIIEDQERAEKTRDDVMRARYEASVDSFRHFRKQLSRILVGKTAFETLADTINGAGNGPRET